MTNKNNQFSLFRVKCCLNCKYHKSYASDDLVCEHKKRNVDELFDNLVEPDNICDLYELWDKTNYYKDKIFCDELKAKNDTKEVCRLGQRLRAFFDF